MRIEERFTPLVLKCKSRGVAMRIGSNHGSLSDRIMNRHGDTPAGMVEAALEFVPKERLSLDTDCGFAPSIVNPMDLDEAYLNLQALCQGAAVRRDKCA